MATEPDYVSVEDLIDDAHEKYNILLSAKHWVLVAKLILAMHQKVYYKF